MKFGQLVEYNKTNISKSLFFSKKALYEEKQVACSLVSIYIDNVQLDIQQKQIV